MPACQPWNARVAFLGTRPLPLLPSSSQTYLWQVYIPYGVRSNVSGVPVVHYCRISRANGGEHYCWPADEP